MRCANPQCNSQSGYLRDGSLFWIDDLSAATGLPRRSFIWLCPACTPLFEVQTWRPPGQQLVLKSSGEPTTLRRQPPQRTPRLHPGTGPLPTPNRS